MICISFGDPLQAIWDRDRKMAKNDFGRKIKATGFIYLPESYFREDKGHFSMRSCSQDAIINENPTTFLLMQMFEMTVIKMHVLSRSCIHNI